MVSPTEATQDNIQKIGDIMHRNMRQMKVRYIIYSKFEKKTENLIVLQVVEQ